MSFKEYVEKNKNKLYKFASENTGYDDQGNCVIGRDDEWIAEGISTEIVYLWDDKKGTVPNGISYGFQEEEST